MFAIEKGQKLHPIDDGHVHIDDDEINLFIWNDRERFARVPGGEDFPRVAGKRLHDVLGHLQKIRFIVQEQNS